MAKKQLHIRASTLAQRQIDDLCAWWGSTITDVVQEAVSRAWHTEAAYQCGYTGLPWIVTPGPHYFATEAAAVRWLEHEQRARRIGPSDWITYDDQDNPETEWSLRPLPLKD